MDKKDYSKFSNLYNIYYIDDNKSKHLAFNLSKQDLSFIQTRFGKQNVHITSRGNGINRCLC